MDPVRLRLLLMLVGVLIIIRSVATLTWSIVFSLLVLPGWRSASLSSSGSLLEHVVRLLGYGFGFLAWYLVTAIVGLLLGAWLLRGPYSLIHRATARSRAI